MTIARSRRAEGGFRSGGAPGRAVHGPPLIPSPPGAAPQPRPNAHAGGGCADDKRGARVGNHGPPFRGGAGRLRRDPPPTPPNGPEAAGAPVPTPPRQRGWSPLPPPERGAGARPAPPAPAAGSYRNRGEQASPRQAPGRRTDRAGKKAGKHKPERYGGHAPHDQNDASDTRFVACPGKAEGRNEAERPPSLLAPPAAQTGGAAHGPPPTPTPPRPPTHERHGPAPRGAHSPKPGRGEPGPDRPPPKHARRSKGPGHAEGHGPRGTALQAPSAGTARGAHATPPRGGGADAAGARAHTHAKGTRGLPEGQPD